MFSHIIRNLEMEIVPDTGPLDECAELVKKKFQQAELEYEEAQKSLEMKKEAVDENIEKLTLLERERMQFMSEMAFQMQTKNDLNKKLEDLNNTIVATDFDLKKYKKMKLSSTDIEKCAYIKKKFLVYKNILKLYFDYSNGADAKVQRGYVYNKITKNIVYFEFKTDEKTPEEISDYLWNKILLVSNKF